MNNKIFLYIAITFVFLCKSCTFGSEGNKLVDERIILNRLLQLGDSLKTSANLQILFLDDQGDDNLASFQMTSGVNTDIYTVTLNSSSEIHFNKIDLYISTSNANIQEIPSPFFHEGDHGSGGEISLSTKVFSTANNYFTSSFFTANGQDEFGYFNASEFFKLSELPQGILQKVEFHFETIILSGSLQGPSATKSFAIQIQNFDHSFTRLCSTNLVFANPLSLTLSIKYSNLFRDTSTSSNIDNTKILRAIHDLPSNNLTISSSENSGIYNEIQKNWDHSTTVKEHRCNK